MLLHTLLLAFAFVQGVQGMAKWMTKEECGKQLQVGEMIMGSKAKFSDKRTIKVYRDNGNILLDNGAVYVPGEELLVMLYGPKDTGIQYVFEAINAGFSGGGCENGRRVANVKLGKLRIPTDATNDVTVVAGWAVGYDNVKITPTFTLVPGDVANTGDGSSAPAAAALDVQPPAAAAANPPSTPPENSMAGEPPKERTNAVEPIKLNLRGGKAPPADNPTRDAAPRAEVFPQRKIDASPSPPPQPPQHLEAIKLTLPNKPAPVMDLSEPEAPSSNGAVKTPEIVDPERPPPPATVEDQDKAESFQRPPLSRQRPLHKFTAVLTEEAPRTPPAAQEPVPAAVKKDTPIAPVAAAAVADTPAVAKTDAEAAEAEEPDTVEDVDAAIDKMQAMIKDMKRKRAEKLKTEKRAKYSKDGPIKLEVKKGAATVKRGAWQGRQAGHTASAGARAGADSNKEGGAIEADREGGQEEEGEEEPEEMESATEARLHRSRKGPKVSQRRGPTGAIYREYSGDASSTRGKDSWATSLSVLASMAVLGLVGLIVIALSVTGVFYVINNAEAVRGFFSRLFRRKQGQDKE